MQTERVAAWRELARRLAHELKNPLFPLQLTVENLMRARTQSPEQFDEVFRESSKTLLAEISNLKGIIGRFSDFSKMPQPQLQPVQVNEIVTAASPALSGAIASARTRADHLLAGIGERLDPIARRSGPAAPRAFESGAQCDGRDAQWWDAHAADAGDDAAMR